MVQVDKFPIAPQLATYVRNIWSLDLSFEGGALALRFTADCFPHLVIRCQNRRDTLKSTNASPVPLMLVKGVSTRSDVYQMAPNYSHIAISFFPDGIKNLFGVDAKDVTNQLVDLTNLIPEDEIDKLMQVQTHAHRAEVVNQLLIRQLQRHKISKDKRITDFLTNPLSNYSQKLEQYNISQRQFERLFLNHVGVSPSLFKRMYRFDQVMNKIRNNTIDSLGELAHQFDYADQAHFCREFKQFTGQSPLVFIKQDRSLEEVAPVLMPDTDGHLIGASIS